MPSSAGAPADARRVERHQRFLAGLGWEPAHFVGQRCEVDPPVWSAGRRMIVDSAAPE